MIYTYHALQRMAQRQISQEDVQWVIAGGNSYAQRHGNMRYYRTYRDEALGRRVTITVITDSGSGTVVTTWWS